MYRTAGTPFIAGVALALAACGGAGSSGGSDARAVTSSGTIAGFGSIYVNGVRYRTDSAEIELEDEGLVTDDRLRLGMMVTVKGIRIGSEGTAQRIVFDSELEGTLDADPTVPDVASPGVGSFTVGGFAVETTADTVFDDDISPRDLTGLASGDRVEVSAFPTAGAFRATRVELDDDPAGGFEVTGVVGEQGFNAGVSLEIQGVTVDIGGAAVDPGVAPGMLVEVEGTPDAGRILATTVEVEDDLLDDDFDDEIELEGILERNAEGIFIGARRVLDPGGLLDLFSTGARVEVKLSRSGDSLVVQAVELEVEDTVRTRDEVFSVQGDTFTTRLGLEIAPFGAVELEDELRDDEQVTVEEFMLNLMPGNRIEAEGFPDGAATTWTGIEREDGGDSGCRLRGHVGADFADPDLAIEGVGIDTTNNGGVQFRDANDQSLSREQFFGALAAGDVVEAKTDSDADCTNGTLFAQEVSFEPADG